MESVINYFIITLGIPALCAIIVSAVFYVSNSCKSKKNNEIKNDKDKNK